MAIRELMGAALPKVDMPEPQPAVKSSPTAEQVDQHLHKLCKDRLMQGDLRRHALRWLIEEKRGGRYDRKPRPHAKKIFEEFYAYAQTHHGTSFPGDHESSGKKLFGELADALEAYYAGPGASDRF